MLAELNRIYGYSVPSSRDVHCDYELYEVTECYCHEAGGNIYCYDCTTYYEWEYVCDGGSNIGSDPVLDKNFGLISGGYQSGGSSSVKEGDPVPCPTLAPTEGISIQGARFGAPRSGGRTHIGIDIAGNVGDPLYSMYTGEIISTGFLSTCGNYIVALYDLNDKTIKVTYCHLNSIDVTSGAVEQGDIIGEIGQTGNADPEKTNTPPHVHIVIRIKTSYGWSDPVDPETGNDGYSFLGTTFDANGNPNEPCN